MQIKNHYFIQALLLFFAALLLTSWDVTQEANNEPSISTPANFEVSLNLAFTGQGQEAALEAYFPTSDDRQQIYLIEHESTGFEVQTQADDNGQRLQWKHTQPVGPQNIGYTIHFSGSAAAYEFPAAHLRTGQYPASLQSYVSSTPSVPSENSFIRRQASELANGSRELAFLLTAFYTYASDRPNEPGPAFASLFYGRKSWKNYLFMTLCRTQDIPARVVNGLEIEAGGAYQVRQWIEVYANDAWIPFDAEARHFAFLPAHFLTLYRGETPFLQYSANLAMQVSLEVKLKEGLIGALTKEF